MSGNPWFLYSAGSQHQHFSEYIWSEIDGLAMFEQVIQPGVKKISSPLENNVSNPNISSLDIWSDNYDYVLLVNSSALDSLNLEALVQFRGGRKLPSDNCHGPKGLPTSCGLLQGSGLTRLLWFYFYSPLWAR